MNSQRLDKPSVKFNLIFANLSLLRNEKYRFYKCYVKNVVLLKKAFKTFYFALYFVKKYRCPSLNY